MKRINLVRSRLFEYGTENTNGALTVFVMVFNICCGKLDYGGNLILLEGALEQDFFLILSYWQVFMGGMQFGIGCRIRHLLYQRKSTENIGHVDATP